MDNKQAIEWLEYIKNEYSWSANCDKALDKAIASLEAWDKVLEEIEQEAFTDVSGCKYIFVNRIKQIINKHLKEIE